MKTRFAPSPTGPFHIGGLRTAILVQAMAQSKDGESMLRIEDTDTKRSTIEFEKEIFSSLDWAGIPFKEPFPHQSDRLPLYDKIITELISKKLAYYCYMTVDELTVFRENIRIHNQKNPDNYLPEKYDNRYRPDNWPNGIPQSIKDNNPNPVVRLILDNNGKTEWKDGAKGLISIDNDKLDDLIIRRSDNSPTYNFVAVIDDMDMRITDVIRGDDHINNTPKQIQISKILRKLPYFEEAKYINYTHLPLMLNPDGSKISKSALSHPDYSQKVANGEVVPAALSDYQKMGILPKALINYLLIISAQKTVQKFKNGILEINDFVKEFKSKDLSISPAKFDLKKLLNVNFHYINSLSFEEFKNTLINFDSSTPINCINFEYVSKDIQKRSKQLTESVLLVKELVNLKNIISLNFDNMTSFAQAGIMCKSEDELKYIFQKESEQTGSSMAEVSKKFREESLLSTVLPFYPTIASFNFTPKPTKKMKV